MIRPESPMQTIHGKITEYGGWVNTHAHIDRAYTVDSSNWHLTNATLQQKWDYVDACKRGATVGEIYGRMSRVVEDQLGQGVQALGSFIDCDSVVQDKALQAAARVRDAYRGDIKLVYANQPLKGLVKSDEYRWFAHAAEFVDIIGGLPERDEADAGQGKQHVDKLVELALEHNKPLHIHADQYNDPGQRDTEMILDQVGEAGLLGRLTLIHCLSLAAQPQSYRREIYERMSMGGVSVIACPTAWIDSRRNETLAVTHNSVTPLDELVPAGVNVALGTDNIADVYKPFSDGNMATELRVLLEATHFYDIDALARIASVNGLKTLDLTPSVSAGMKIDVGC